MIPIEEKTVTCPHCLRKFKLEVPQKGIVFHDVCQHCNNFMAYNYKGEVLGADSSARHNK